jgi:hypothetical protein
MLLQVDGIGRVQISKTIYNFTDMQDVRLVLGCKAHVDQKGKITPVRFCAYMHFSRHDPNRQALDASLLHEIGQAINWPGEPRRP